MAARGRAPTVLDASPASSVGLAETARLRQGAYRLFAALLLYPEAPRLAAVAAAAQEFQQYDPLVARFAFFGPWRHLLSVLAEPLTDQLTELEAEYTRLFLVDARALPCPPYESSYRERHGEVQGWIEARLQQAYLAGGVVVSPGLGELPDHVAVELEFMAHLCDQEAAAWEAVGANSRSPLPLGHSPLPPAEAIQALERQRAFLNRHLGVWFAAFAQRVVATTHAELYRAAARAATAFIHHDRDLVALLMEKVCGCSTSAAIA